MEKPLESTSEQPVNGAGASGGAREQNKPDTNVEMKISLPKSLFNTAQNILQLQEQLTQPKPTLKARSSSQRHNNNNFYIPQPLGIFFIKNTFQFH